MTITFDLPPAAEQSLRQEWGENLNAAARETVLVELYRLDKLTHYELSTALGISRLETETVFKKHGVTEDLPTEQEIQAAARSPRKFQARMTAISDTTPLNYLVLIGAVDVLPQLFSTIHVPPSVIAELVHAKTPTVVRQVIDALLQTSFRAPREQLAAALRRVAMRKRP